MPNTTLNGLARCPFYRYDRGRRLVCEGVTDQATAATDFPDRESFDAYTAAYCCDRFENCLLSATLMKEKYGAR